MFKTCAILDIRSISVSVSAMLVMCVAASVHVQPLLLIGISAV